MYYTAKVAFVYWLVNNRFEGANAIFERYLNPMLQQHESQIDKTLEDTKDKLQTTALQCAESAWSKAQQQIQMVTGKLTKQVAEQIANNASKPAAVDAKKSQ